ncbi:MAG: hypothetical protein FJY88_02595 [Candidatus Eisenbacteria bacterium]|nr:hypothetical protein [Candidatus Eisenbacteria bacterium]
MIPDQGEPRAILGGKYEILGEIGRGGMGIVYKGIQKSLGRLVAIKTLPAQLAANQEFVSRFRREAEALARLKHENIVTVYDLEQEDESYVLVIEFVEGMSLSRLLSERGRLEPGHAAEIARQIASALAAAHRHGIVHRDIKPDNVLIESSDGKAKVADFGIAAMAGSAFRTTTGVMLGTPRYMAPEQIRGEPVTGAADIYALGLLLYEMIAGSPPFDGENPMTIAYQHLNNSPPPLAARAPHCPPALIEIVERAMQKEAGKRFASAGEMAEALCAACAGRRAAPGLPPGRRLRRTPRWAWIAGASATAAAITIGGVHLLSPVGSDRPGSSPRGQEIERPAQPGAGVVLEERAGAADRRVPSPGGAGPSPGERTASSSEVDRPPGESRTSETSRAQAIDLPTPRPADPGESVAGDGGQTDGAEQALDAESRSAGGPAASAPLTAVDEIAVRRLVERWSERVSRKNLAALLNDVAPQTHEQVRNLYAPLFSRCERLRASAVIVRIQAGAAGDQTSAVAAFVEETGCEQAGAQEIVESRRLELGLIKSGPAWIVTEIRRSAR